MSAPTSTGRTSTQAAHRLSTTLDATLQRLKEGSALTRHVDIQEVIRLSDMLRRDDEGLALLADRITEFEAVGFFDKTPWEHLDRLVPNLVAGGFAAGGQHAVMETLNALRVLAIAEGRLTPKPLADEEEKAAPVRFTKQEAMGFLGEVVALNAWALFPGESEATRHMDRIQLEATGKLFQYLVEKMPETELLTWILDEVEQVSAQRPILVDSLFDRIRLAGRVAKKHGGKDPRLARYAAAIDGPGPISSKSDESGYLQALEAAGVDERKREAEACAKSVMETGLVCRQHALLVRWANEHEPNLLDRALGLDSKGRLERRLNDPLVRELIPRAVTPENAQAVDGLGRTLDRGLLSRHEVAEGLRRLMRLELHPEVQKLLESTSPGGLDGTTRLLSGALRVLGRPLGIGQGRNPTCQSARGISLWSLNRPGYLLELVATAARDGYVTMWFLGELVDSRNLIGGLMDDMHPELDPVSLVLVPHLDRIYNEMMRRVVGRGEDGHKWVNPAMYGRMVPGALAVVFDQLTGQPADVRTFVEQFYRTHHPDHAAEHGMIYPNPVGLIITSAHAAFVGFHAVTIQRIARDEEGDLRVYFYNPNNESRQDWGQEIVPTVTGHGEKQGECSLPFYQFTSRLYAFHYDPFWVGAGDELTDEQIDRVMELIEESWLKTGPWAALVGHT